tara:strand:- start:569 stop:1051 length:483 start_codon:yes stop_codon:yes gene_type:complete
MEEEKTNIKVKVIMEIMGSPEEHINKTMDMVVDKMKNADYFRCLTEKISEINKIEDKPFWSKFVDAELEFNNVDDVTGFCLDFMPSSLEILEPNNFNFKKELMENYWNDLIAKLHQYDMMVKNLHAENLMIKKELKKYRIDAAQPKPSDVVVEKSEEKKE